MTDLPAAVMFAACTMKNNGVQLNVPNQFLVTHCHLFTPYLIVKQQLFTLPTVKQSAAVTMSMPWGKVPCGDRISPRIRLEIHTLNRLHRTWPVALQISVGVFNGSEWCLCKRIPFCLTCLPTFSWKAAQKQRKGSKHYFSYNFSCMWLHYLKIKLKNVIFFSVKLLSYPEVALHKHFHQPNLKDITSKS